MRIRTKLTLMVTSLVAIMGIAFATHIGAVYVDTTPDYDKYAVVYGGTASESQVRAEYNKGDHAAVFKSFGIAQDAITGTKAGVVYQNGNVTVGGKVVAKNAVMGARYLGGSSIAGSTTAKRVSVSAMGSAQAAIVKLDSQGRFLWAIMTPCGNPVNATNVVVPPKPVYACKDIVADKISRTEYRFGGHATAANGATIKSYTYDFGDGQNKTVTTGGVNHTYAKPGTYTATLTVAFTVDGKTVTNTNDACKTTVTVDEELVPGVSIEKTVNGKEHQVVEVGEDFTYELVVKNIGQVELKDAVVTDEAPTGVTFKSTDKGSITGNALSYTISSLAVDASETITITAVMSEYTAGTTINTACVETPTVPGGNPDDCDDATIETKVERCDTTTDTIVTITAEEAKDERYTEDLTQCDEVKVCDIESGLIINVPVNDKDNEGYAAEDSDKCKVDVCNPDTGEIITVDKADENKYVDKDSDKCKEVVVPPTKTVVTELPETGIADSLSAVLGLGSLTAATYYYIASRRT